MNFYVPLPDGGSTLQQGDLLEGVPFCYFSLSQARAVLSDGGLETRDLSTSRAGIVGLLAKVEFGWGMLISQTCDVQPDPETGYARKPVLLARVRPIREIVSSFRDATPSQAVDALAGLVTAARSPTVLYLPAHELSGGSFPRSGANLLDVQRFQPLDLPALSRLLRLRLSDPALQALQERCAYCFGRYGAPDDLYYSAEEWAERQRKEEARRQSRGR
jgi:hypothetical protein